MVTKSSANTPTGTSGTILQGQGAGVELSLSTATYPATTTVSQILYSSATNTVSGLTTANNSILSTNGSGIPGLGTSLSNDYTFTSSTAAVERILTVSSTDNTNTSTAATVVVSSGGASAGDAKYQATITGAQTWSWGADNSDSDAFVLSSNASLGTTNVMRSSTAGEINYPLQPAFSAVAGTQTNITGDGTVYTVTYASEIFDQNGDFDGTSTFTAPVTGRYSLNGGITSSGTTASHTTGQIKVTTSNRNFQPLAGSWASFQNSGNTSGFSWAWLTDMDAADTCTTQLTVSNGTKVIDIATGLSYFNGHLAC